MVQKMPHHNTHKKAATLLITTRPVVRGLQEMYNLHPIAPQRGAHFTDALHGISPTQKVYVTSDIANAVLPAMQRRIKRVKKTDTPEKIRLNDSIFIIDFIGDGVVVIEKYVRQQRLVTHT
jgi:hypothetical protein